MKTAMCVGARQRRWAGLARRPRSLFLARLKRNLHRHFFGFHFDAAKPDLAVELQITGVTAMTPINLAIVGEVSDLRIEANYPGSRLRQFDHRTRHPWRQQALVIIRDDRGVGVRQSLVERSDDPIFDAA